MLSMQHVLSARLQNVNCNNSTYMAALVFPDAIRKYSGLRQYSHFEKGSDGINDTSYWEMPTDMKSVTKHSIKANLEVFAHISNSIIPAAIGEDTDIGTFYEHNMHLPAVMYHGIEDHLKQDIAFDSFIREQIDCSQKYKDIYFFKGQEMNGKDVRNLIGDIEQHGIYILAHEIYKNYDELTNQSWFDEKIKPVLFGEYPADLANTTFSYMTIRSDINELITNKDWSRLTKGPVSYDCYKDLYKQVLSFMNKGLSGNQIRRVPCEFRDYADNADDFAAVDLEL